MKLTFFVVGLATFLGASVAIASSTSHCEGITDEITDGFRAVYDDPGPNGADWITFFDQELEGLMEDYAECIDDDILGYDCEGSYSSSSGCGNWSCECFSVSDCASMQWLCTFGDWQHGFRCGGQNCF